MDNFEQYGFVILTNESLTISGVEGWRYLSIYVTSASSTNATISSSYSGTIGGKQSGNIILTGGQSISLGSGNNSIDGVTITAPSGCTIHVLAVKYKPVL